MSWINPTSLFFIGSFVLFALSVVLCFINKQSLFCAFFFLLSLIFFGAFLVFALIGLNLWASPLTVFIVGALATIFLLGLLAFPLSSLIYFYYFGIKNIRKEGLTLGNALSLGVAFLLTFYLLVFPFLHINLPVLKVLYNIIAFTASYLVFLFLLMGLSNVLNLWHFKKEHLDYIVVLGCGLLNGNRVPPLLASRILKGIEVWQKHQSATLIFSGGQGDNETLPEAIAMKNYALLHGVPETAILVEDKSRNTKENLMFSHALMQKNAKFAVVSSSYHIFRAVMIAKELKLKPLAFGAKTKWYYTQNAFVREFVAYLALSKKTHLFILSIVALLNILTLFLS